MPTPLNYPIKRSPKHDPQQYRVYRMENEAIGARQYRTLSHRDILTIVRCVCRNYSVPRPTVQWRRLGRWAAEWTPKTEYSRRCIIRFNPDKGSSWDLLTVTHELAHHIHHKLSGGRDEYHEAHGAEFMAVHMSILDTLRIIPVVGMRAICRTWKIRFADPGTSESLRRLKRICRI